MPGGLARYLGAGLDPALVDLAAPAAAGPTVPVSLTFPGFGDPSSFDTATTGLNDVTAGNNDHAISCGGGYPCTSGPGYDGPTGNGTPEGLSAFGG